MRLQRMRSNDRSGILMIDERMGYSVLCCRWKFPVSPPPSNVRSEYLIDRHLVVFEPGKGCHCVCNEFDLTGECRHTRESAGRRAAQELIAKRVRSVHGTLTGFSHHERQIASRASKRERTRSLALQRIR